MSYERDNKEWGIERMSRDDEPIDDFDCVMTVDDGHEENETIFIVYFVLPYETNSFRGAFYTHEKAQKYCDDMRKFVGSSYYAVEEVEIK